MVGLALGSRVEAEDAARIERAVENIIDTGIARAEKAHSADDDDPSPRALPWAVARGILATVVIMVLALSVAWLWNIEGRTAAAEEYQRGLAAYLVQSADANGAAHTATDAMLRRMAEAQGVNVRDIEKPITISPPNSVRRRALDAASP